VNFRIDYPEDIAKLIRTKIALNLRGGMLVANPIPEAYSMSKEFINSAIDEAIIEMNKLGIKGKETTPYLLGKIVELTKGKSLESNIKLVYNNCELGAQIARELKQLGV
jgi:pseudouridine-5'-phosphate glycosidase